MPDCQALGFGKTNGTKTKKSREIVLLISLHKHVAE